MWMGRADPSRRLRRHGECVVFAGSFASASVSVLCLLCAKPSVERNKWLTFFLFWSLRRAKFKANLHVGFGTLVVSLSLSPISQCHSVGIGILPPSPPIEPASLFPGTQSSTFHRHPPTHFDESIKEVLFYRTLLSMTLISRRLPTGSSPNSELMVQYPCRLKVRGQAC